MPNPFLQKTTLFQTIQFSMSTQFNYQKHFYFKLFGLFKKFLFQPIQLSINIDLVYTQLNVKNNSISNNSV